MVEQLISVLHVIMLTWLSTLTVIIWHAYRQRQTDIGALMRVSPAGLGRRVLEVEQRQDSLEAMVKEELSTMRDLCSHVEHVIPHLDGAVRMMTRLSQSVTLLADEIKEMGGRQKESTATITAVCLQLERVLGNGKERV